MKQSPTGHTVFSGTNIHAARRFPVQARTQRKVMQILEATAQLIEKMPLEEITTSDIARAAKITTSTVYRFFPHREAIFDNLLISYMGKFREMYEEALIKTKAKDGAEITGEMIDVRVRFMNSHPGVKKLFTSREIDPNLLRRARGPSNPIPRVATTVLAERFGMKMTPQLSRRLAISAETGNRILAMAFRQPEAECAAIIEDLKRMLTFLVFGPPKSPMEPIAVPTGKRAPGKSASARKPSGAKRSAAARK